MFAVQQRTTNKDLAEVFSCRRRTSQAPGNCEVNRDGIETKIIDETENGMEALEYELSVPAQVCWDPVTTDCMKANDNRNVMLYAGISSGGESGRGENKKARRQWYDTKIQQKIISLFMDISLGWYCCC